MVEPYAAAFWLFDIVEDGRGVITVSFSMPDNHGVIKSEVSSDEIELGKSSKFRRKVLSLPPVEEARSLSPHEAAWIDIIERAIATKLTWFAQRALFKQCTGMFRSFDDFMPVDNLLVFGPELHKFTGRICYLLMNRNKTVAVLSPDWDRHRTPLQSANKWDDVEPAPSYWVDCAARKWDRKLPSENLGSDEAQAKIGLASFQIIISIGDGFNSIVQSEIPRGRDLWLKKSKGIQKILDEDSEVVRLAMWKNEGVRLPKAVALAGRAAVLSHQSKLMEDEIKRIGQTFSDAVGRHDQQLGPYFLKSEPFKQIAISKIMARAEKGIGIKSDENDEQSVQYELQLAALDRTSDQKRKLIAEIQYCIQPVLEDIRHTLGADFV